MIKNVPLSKEYDRENKTGLVSLSSDEIIIVYGVKRYFLYQTTIVQSISKFKL